MKVSVVTPSYNQGAFIGRTLRSVAMQDIAGLEHLVFDGGSTDSTLAVLGNAEPPVRWVSARDRGQTDALNQGIRASEGEIIGWLNSDDVYYPGAIARVLEVFRDHPEVDVVYGMADHIDVDDHAFEDYPTTDWDFELLKERCFICQPALFFRRRVVERHGLPDERLQYCMDYEYWLRLGKAGVRFHYLPHKLAGSRLYADNKTLGARVAVHREINDMMRRMFGKVPDRWLSNYAHALVDARVDRAHAPRRYIVCLMLHVTLAALRWNRGLSPSLMRLLRAWGMHAYRL